jgi:hypothetical protein
VGSYMFISDRSSEQRAFTSSPGLGKALSSSARP